MKNKTTPLQSIMGIQSNSQILYMRISFLGKLASRRYNSQHISTFSTIGSTTTSDRRTFSLMYLTPFAPAFLPHYQFPSVPPISLCKPTTMSLPLAQIFCGMPPSISPAHAPAITQPITDSLTPIILPLIQSKNPSRQDAEIFQPPPGSSSLLPSSLQKQAQCVQAIHKTIQQFYQHLKADKLNRRTLRIIVLQLQNEFALLRYLLFSIVGATPISDTSLNNSTISPLIAIKPIRNPNPT